MSQRYLPFQFYHFIQPDGQSLGILFFCCSYVSYTWKMDKDDQVGRQQAKLAEAVTFPT